MSKSNTTAFVGGLLLALFLTGPASAAGQCPKKPFSIADAKGLDQLGACARLVNKMNLDALSPVYILRLTSNGVVDGFAGLTPADVRNDLVEYKGSGIAVHVFRHNHSLYALATRAYRQFVGLEPAHNDFAHNPMAQLVARYTHTTSVTWAPSDEPAEERAVHAEDQASLPPQGKR